MKPWLKAVILMVCALGWGFNIISLIHEPTVLKAIGVVIFPIGIIMGLI